MHFVVNIEPSAMPIKGLVLERQTEISSLFNYQEESASRDLLTGSRSVTNRHSDFNKTGAQKDPAKLRLESIQVSTKMLFFHFRFSKASKVWLFIYKKHLTLKQERQSLHFKMLVTRAGHFQYFSNKNLKILKFFNNNKCFFGIFTELGTFGIF